MNISEKRHKKLYDAIYNPIMALRVKNAMCGVNNLDEELFVLENRIYKEIKEALDLKQA